MDRTGHGNCLCFFFSSRRRHTRWTGDWSSDVCSSDLRARYLFAKREWEHWSAEPDPDTARIMADSVKPVLDAGLADLVAMDHRLSSEIWLEPTPGHTPGHASVRLEAEGRAAVITGDLMHHPVQVAEPEWGSHFDSDLDEARKTRRAFCERYAGTGALVLGTHFHHPTAGRIVRHGETWRFAPA